MQVEEVQTRTSMCDDLTLFILLPLRYRYDDIGRRKQHTSTTSRIPNQANLTLPDLGIYLLALLFLYNSQTRDFYVQIYYIDR